MINDIIAKFKNLKSSITKNDDKVFVLNEIKKNGLYLSQVSYRLSNDIEVVSEAIENEPLAIEFASKELRNNKDIALRCVQKNGLTLMFLSKELQDNEHIVSFSIRKNPYALEYASDRIKDMEHIVILAFNRFVNSYLITFLSDRLKHDKEFILRLIKNSRIYFEYLPVELQLDKDIINHAIKDHLDLHLLPTHLLFNDKVLIYLLEQPKTNHGQLFDNLSAKYKENPAFALYLLKKSPQLFPLLPIELRDNELFLKDCLKNKINIYYFISENLKKNLSIAKISVNNFSYSYKQTHETLKKNYNLATIAVKKEGSNLEYVHPDIKDEKLFILALKTYDNATQYFLKKDDFFHDKTFVKFILESKLGKLPFFKYISPTLMSDKEIALLGIKNDGRIITILEDNLKADKDIIYHATKTYAQALMLANFSLQNDPEFILSLVKQNKITINYIGKELYEIIDILNPIESLEKLILYKKLNNTLSTHTYKHQIKI